ncbi:MAG: polyphosphate polymerase domain-containing protein [Micrococcaceae bacterium]|nr:polyphosphate polymerase domain-containing protein [Micrococcaceae bacterium]
MKARQALEDAVAAREPIGLQEVNEGAALQTRVDHKYLLTPGQFTALAAKLDDRFRVLTIDGRRTFRYESVYFDTPEFEQYRAHRQGRRRRYKVRTRTYADTGLCMFEIKTKGLRGATVKHRIPHQMDDAGRMTSDARSFLDGVIAAEYSMSPAALQPVMESDYRRATFVDPVDGERLTCDVDLVYSDQARTLHGPELFVIETKTASGQGAASTALSELGIRPVSMSKYCVGIAMLHPELPANKWSRLLRRNFQWEPPRAAAA